ncbi:MAG: pseudaminic acid synthase [Candidatus Muirbacterium halophilum]|nr:pseudaminic acid synthase [Candidatus Muirbacterium halophilum]
MAVFIIAELSANHNNSFELAVESIKSMAEAGVDAVKIQTYKPESLTLDMDTGYFAPRSEGLWKGYTSWRLYKEASMPYKWQPKLKKIAEDFGLIFFSTPFDKEGVDFLETIDIPIYKIASLEITDVPLIKYVASKGKPMIISTGVADISDIELALTTCREAGNNDITLLKCTSNYPAKISDANLLTIPDMKKRFGVKVGVSDHTMGSLVPIVAVSLGAEVVEKHFILDRNLGGPDSAFSMEPLEFKRMVEEIRETESSLGVISYNVSEKDKVRRRSLFVVQDIKKGDKLTSENIRSIRPGNGLHPKHYNNVIGKIAKFDIERGSALDWEMI